MVKPGAFLTRIVTSICDRKYSIPEIDGRSPDSIKGRIIIVYVRLIASGGKW